jgi:hypothetical protein
MEVMEGRMRAGVDLREGRMGQRWSWERGGWGRDGAEKGEDGGGMELMKGRIAGRDRDEGGEAGAGMEMREGRQGQGWSWGREDWAPMRELRKGMTGQGWSWGRGAWLIKKKKKFSSFIRNSDGIGCKSYMRKGFLIYEECANI